MSILTLIDKNGKPVTPRDRFFGFGTIQEVRMKLEALESSIRENINKAYGDEGDNEYPRAAAALLQFDDAEFVRLGNRLKGRGLALPRWERMVRDLARQERTRIESDKESAALTTQAAGAASEPLAPPPPPPWAAPVVASDLLNELRDFIGRFVVTDDHSLTAVALWVAFTHCFDAAECSPRLAVLSPTKRCGKTRLLELLLLLCPKPLSASNLTSSVVFRVIEAERPTLLIDEADTFLAHDDQLRGVVNSGHTPATAFVIRNVRAGDDWQQKRFSTWAPIAIAAIGRLPATIEDRSIIISMKRKPVTRSVERLTRRNVAARAQAAELASKLARLVADNLDPIKQARTLPANLASDRAEDNWEPLLAIADLAGADWAERAREAARALSSDSQASADASDLGVHLLRAIRLIFTACHTDRLASAWIVAALTESERFADGPWCAYGRARRPITQNQLARILEPFAIRPGTIRLADQSTIKGYKLAQFRDAFAVYLAKPPLPPSPDRHTVTTVGRVEENEDFKPSHPNSCDGSKNGISVHAENGCDGVTDQNPLIGTDHENIDENVDSDEGVAITPVDE